MHRLAALTLVQLEDRTVLADFSWAPQPGGDHNWWTSDNWDRKDVTGKWIDSLAWPTDADTATFGAGASYCNIDQDTTVTGINVAPLFTSNLYILSKLYIKSYTKEPALNLAGSGRIGGGVFPGPGGGPARGSIYIGETINGNSSKPATMYWTGGSLEYLDIYVDANSKVTVDGVASPKAMIQTEFYVDGLLDWYRGNVTVPGVSKVVIQSGGTFDIAAGGYSWGNAGPSLTTENYGYVRKFAGGVAELGGDYSSSGRTRIEAGTLHHSGQYISQTAGMYELYAGTTSKVTNTNGLRIFDGGIIGLGTVDGNLKLGYVPGAVGAGFEHPSITPSIDGVHGTLTITGNFDMLSGGASMHITVDAAGKNSKVEVTGVHTATLNGTLWLTVSQEYKPPPDTRQTFLTAFGIVGDFSRKESTWWGSWGAGGQSVSWKLEKGTSHYDLLSFSPPPGS